MIVRSWRAKATRENAPFYQKHFTTKVVPHLNDISGHRGAYLIRRDVGDHVEIVALTLWDNIEVVKAFSGDDPSRSHVEPEAKAVLLHSDDFADNYEVVHPVG